MNSLEELRKKILLMNKAYEQGNSLVPDFVYDFYKKQLKLLEENTYVKIADQIGSEVSSEDKVKHLFPILSLNHDFGKEAIEKCVNRIQKITDPFPFIAEVKIDGVSVVVRYENGLLQHIATRGNGTFGENITFLKDFLAIPEKIHLTQTLDLRFEAYINKNLITNPRNAVAGALLKKTADSNLKHVRFAPHNLYSAQKIWDDYIGLRNIVTHLHLHPITPFKICHNLNDMLEFFDEINEKKSKLSFEIDGIVFKVNNYEKQQLIGSTAHSPKFAFAIKFDNPFAISVITDIKFQVGRFGKITPVAYIQDAIIDNRKITKATLNNFAELEKNNYAPGDIVKIEMAGQVIPMISDIIEKSRNSLQLVTHCPSCNFELAGDVCRAGWNCAGQILERLSHFGSKHGLDIQNMGEKQIEFFMQQNILKYPYEFFELSKSINKVNYNPSWLGPKALQNMLDAIELAKYCSMEKWYTALGIPHIGKTKAKVLSENFKNFDKFLQAEIADFEFLGKEIAKNIFEYKESEKFWIEKTWQYMKVGQNFENNSDIISLF